MRTEETATRFPPPRLRRRDAAAVRFNWCGCKISHISRYCRTFLLLSTQSTRLFMPQLQKPRHFYSRRDTAVTNGRRYCRSKLHFIACYAATRRQYFLSITTYAKTNKWILKTIWQDAATYTRGVVTHHVISLCIFATPPVNSGVCPNHDTRVPSVRHIAAAVSHGRANNSAV